MRKIYPDSIAVGISMYEFYTHILLSIQWLFSSVQDQFIQNTINRMNSMLIIHRSLLIWSQYFFLVVYQSACLRARLEIESAQSKTYCGIIEHLSISTNYVIASTLPTSSSYCIFCCWAFLTSLAPSLAVNNCSHAVGQKLSIGKF